MKLNLGSSVWYRDGWVNVDLNRQMRADLYEDVQTLPSMQPESVDEIYAGHILEHVEDLKTTLRRWFKVLKRDGKITITVPDAIGAGTLWFDNRHFPGIDMIPDHGIAAILVGYGTRPTVGLDEFTYQRHRRVFDQSSLSLCLEFAGFVRLRNVNDHEIMVMPCSQLGWQIAMEGWKP